MLALFLPPIALRRDALFPSPPPFFPLQAIKRLARTVETAGNTLHLLASLHLLPLLEEALMRLALLAALLGDTPTASRSAPASSPLALRFLPFEGGPRESQAARQQADTVPLPSHSPSSGAPLPSPAPSSPSFPSPSLSAALRGAMDEATAALAGTERLLRQLAAVLPQVTFAHDAARCSGLVTG